MSYTRGLCIANTKRCIYANCSHMHAVVNGISIIFTLSEFDESMVAIGDSETCSTGKVAQVKKPNNACCAQCTCGSGEATEAGDRSKEIEYECDEDIREPLECPEEETTRKPLECPEEETTRKEPPCSSEEIIRGDSPEVCSEEHVVRRRGICTCRDLSPCPCRGSCESAYSTPSYKSVKKHKKKILKRDRVKKCSRERRPYCVFIRKGSGDVREKSKCVFKEESKTKNIKEPKRQKTLNVIRHFPGKKKCSPTPTCSVEEVRTVEFSSSAVFVKKKKRRVRQKKCKTRVEKEEPTIADGCIEPSPGKKKIVIEEPTSDECIEPSPMKKIVVKEETTTSHECLEPQPVKKKVKKEKKTCSPAKKRPVKEISCKEVCLKNVPAKTRVVHKESPSEEECVKPAKTRKVSPRQKKKICRIVKECYVDSASEEECIKPAPVRTRSPSPWPRKKKSRPKKNETCSESLSEERCSKRIVCCKEPTSWYSRATLKRTPSCRPVFANAGTSTVAECTRHAYNVQQCDISGFENEKRKALRERTVFWR